MPNSPAHIDLTGDSDVDDAVSPNKYKYAEGESSKSCQRIRKRRFDEFSKDERKKKLDEARKHHKLAKRVHHMWLLAKKAKAILDNSENNWTSRR
jgi:hypothetical protein